MRLPQELPPGFNEFGTNFLISFCLEQLLWREETDFLSNSLFLKKTLNESQISETSCTEEKCKFILF